jgi:hypothetical protein
MTLHRTIHRRGRPSLDHPTTSGLAVAVGHERARRFVVLIVGFDDIPIHDH